MERFATQVGRVAPLDAINVDTDQIIPKQFLKRIERSGFGQFLFYDWRLREDGTPDPDFSLNDPRHDGATILLARRNFGCGSSRKHAPWALLDYGFRIIVAPSFGDIFRANCFKNGVLPIALSETVVDRLFQIAAGPEPLHLSVDLATQVIEAPDGTQHAFDVDPFRKQCLLEGLDDIGWTLQYADAIDAYEATRDAQPF